MSDSDTADEFESQVDGILPESVDRRRFLLGTVATVAGAGLAGCSGGGGGGDGGGGDGGDGGEPSPTEPEGVIWRYGWKAEPSYSIGFVAEERGIWSDNGINDLNVLEGFGSGDAAKRVGSGKEQLGMASVFPIVTNYVEGGEYVVYGAGKPMSQLGLIYNTETVDGPDDLEGTTITRSSSAPQELSWPFFMRGHGYSEGDIEVQGASEEGAAAQLAQGKIDGVYDTISDFTAIQGQTDLEVGFAPLWNVAKIYGYPTFVNTSFLEDRGMEYMTNLMTAYSAAGKWVLLNPEKAVDIMRNDVNTDLQTVSKETLLNGLRAAVVAVNTTDTVKNEGFGYLDVDVMEKTIEVIGSGIEGDMPSVDEITNTEIQESAELSSFTDSEWDEVISFAEPFGEFYA